MLQALLLWSTIGGSAVMILARLWSGPPARPGTEARTRLDQEIADIDAEIELLAHRT